MNSLKEDIAKLHELLRENQQLQVEYRQHVADLKKLIREFRSKLPKKPNAKETIPKCPHGKVLPRAAPRLVQQPARKRDEERTHASSLTVDRGPANRSVAEKTAPKLAQTGTLGESTFISHEN